MSITPTLDHEPQLLAAARAGDHDAFTALVAPHRRALHLHCYRMLGSLHDADDALQEAQLLAWRGLHTFAGRAPLRHWLYRIATTTCLRMIPGSGAVRRVRPTHRSLIVHAGHGRGAGIPSPRPGSSLPGDYWPILPGDYWPILTPGSPYSNWMSWRRVGWPGRSVPVRRPSGRTARLNVLSSSIAIAT